MPGVICVYVYNEIKFKLNGNTPKTYIQWRICIPSTLFPTVLWYLHNAHIWGYLGIEKITDKTKNKSLSILLDWYKSDSSRLRKSMSAMWS